MDPFEVIEGGEVRRLGTMMPMTAVPDTLNDEFGTVGPAVMIQRADWKPVSYKQFFPRIKDQDGIGQCNCSATGNVTEGCRRMAGGLSDVDLSAGDLYRRVSGGVDRGSLPEDALKELMKNGMAPTSAVPYLEWRKNNATADAERPKYKITEALWCPTFEHVASALQQGFLVDIGIWWYGSDPLDADGWLKPTGGRGRGGHAICCMELAKRGDQWGIGFVNSWGPQWGRAGFGIMPEQRAAEGCQVFTAWACRATLQESGNFPAPVEN
jgi:hypothetical protein